MVFPIMTFIEYHVNLIYPAEAELKRRISLTPEIVLISI